MPIVPNSSNDILITFDLSICSFSACKCNQRTALHNYNDLPLVLSQGSKTFAVIYALCLTMEPRVRSPPTSLRTNESPRRVVEVGIAENDLRRHGACVR